MQDQLVKEILKRIFNTTKLVPDEGNGGDYVVTDRIITPYLYVIKIKPIKVSTSRFINNQLANDLKLVTNLDQSEQVVIDIHKGFVSIQIPKPQNERGHPIYTSENILRGSGLRIPLGLDIFTEPLYFNFSDPLNTNLSFLGVPGSGKSVSMRNVITALARNNDKESVKFLMLEVSKGGIDLSLFDQLPHLIHPMITNPEEAEQALGWVAARITEDRLPFKLVVCIDEVAELVNKRPNVIGLLKTLVSQGRAMNVVNLLATQISDRDTLGDGKAIFKQIHNVILGKVGNKQLSYILGNRSNLNGEALVGKGDLLLNSNDVTTRFTGIFTTKEDVELLPKAELTNFLPLQEYTNTEAIIKGIGAPSKDVPPNIIVEGLVSLQDQIDSKTQRSKPYYVMPANRAIKLGRNAETFKTRDQPYITNIYKELYKKGYRLCKK